LGEGACPNAADRPPVSEFESPKLNIAGKSHEEADARIMGLNGSDAIHIKRPNVTCLEGCASIGIGNVKRLVTSGGISRGDDPSSHPFYLKCSSSKEEGSERIWRQLE